mmetsp:Transcript_10036/g.12524  ORF Transcript_10036/g.12524 Transcript_10036/m.12524 type:complete len:198 (+) Transcript_10036:127-720(+)
MFDGDKLTTIVVLGLALNPDGSAPPDLLERVEKAAELSIELGGLSMIVCGGDPKNIGIKEAEVMKKELVARGVQDGMIAVESKSLITVHNAYEAIQFLASECKRILLVTSDFHMPRALYVFEAVFASQGLSFEIEPHPAESNGRKAKKKQRLRDEIDALVRRTPNDLKTIKGVNIPLPSKKRLDEAVSQVNEMLAEI